MYLAEMPLHVKIIKRKYWFRPRCKCVQKLRFWRSHPVHLRALPCSHTTSSWYYIYHTNPVLFGSICPRHASDWGSLKVLTTSSHQSSQDTWCSNKVNPTAFLLDSSNIHRRAARLIQWLILRNIGIQLIAQKNRYMLLWANEYLSTQNQLFLTGFQRPDGQSFSHIPKVFNLVFVLANPSFIGLLSPSSILDYRLITLFFAPCPPLGRWRNTTVRKTVFRIYKSKKDF